MIDFISPRLKRRLIVLCSVFGMGLSMVSLGTCMYLIETGQTNLTFLRWLPIVSVIIFLVLGNGGLGTLIWVISVELLPGTSENRHTHNGDKVKFLYFS